MVAHLRDGLGVPGVISSNAPHDVSVSFCVMAVARMRWPSPISRTLSVFYDFPVFYDAQQPHPNFKTRA
jgi:hypothetical protein